MSKIIRLDDEVYFALKVRSLKEGKRLAPLMCNKAQLNENFKPLAAAFFMNFRSVETYPFFKPVL
jgi:hypothetical protein